MQEPTIGMLATGAGLAGVVWLIMQVVRTLVPAPTFDRYGAALAVLVGIILSLAYAFVAATPAKPLDGSALLEAVLVGLFGGWMSQNANHMVTRASGS